MINVCSPKLILCDTLLILRFKRILKHAEQLNVGIYSADTPFSKIFIKDENMQRISSFKATECADNHTAVILTTRNASVGRIKGIPLTHNMLYQAVCNARYCRLVTQ